MSALFLQYKRYVWCVCALVLAFYLIIFGLYFIFPENISYLAGEGQLIENMAAFTLGICVLLSGYNLITQKIQRPLWLWIMSITFLGFCRELDEQKWLKEHLGIRWKMSWLSAETTPLYLKIILITLTVGMTAVLIGPPLRYRKQIWSAIKTKNPFVWLFLGGISFLLLGVLFDGSMLGKKFFYHIFTAPFGMVIEEAFETGGVILMLSAILPSIKKAPIA